jgi:hypothetical protein
MPSNNGMENTPFFTRFFYYILHRIQLREKTMNCNMMPHWRGGQQKMRKMSDWKIELCESLFHIKWPPNTSFFESFITFKVGTDWSADYVQPKTS